MGGFRLPLHAGASDDDLAPGRNGRDDRWKFLLWTTAGAAIWNTVLAGAGLVLGSRYGELEHYVGPFAIAVFAIMAAAYVYRVVTWRPRG